MPRILLHVALVSIGIGLGSLVILLLQSIFEFAPGFNPKLYVWFLVPGVAIFGLDRFSGPRS